MLPRAQVRRLVEQGREIASAIEANLVKRDMLRTDEEEAFSTGHDEDWHRLRAERQNVEEEASQGRSALLVVLQELAEDAKVCLDQYQREMAEAGRTPAAFTILSSVQPSRIQECRRYFDEVEQAVNDVTSRLMELRREELLPSLSELQSLLVRLKALGEELPAVEQYLSAEAFFDLPIADGRRRLHNEIALLQQRVVECEKLRQEQEREKRLNRAREALAWMADADTQKSPITKEEVCLAAALLDEGTLEDARRFWEAAGRLLLVGTAAFLEDLAGIVTSALDKCLDPANEKPQFEFLRSMRPDVLLRLDGLLQDHPNTPRLAAACRSTDTTDVSLVSRLCTLKESLPKTSFAILQALEDDVTLSVKSLSTFFLATPTRWPGLDAAAEWLARTFEERGVWRAAHVCWAVATSNKATGRGTAALLVALAEDARLVPDSENSLWGLLSKGNDLHDTAPTAAAAAVAVLLLGRRASIRCDEQAGLMAIGLESHEALRTYLRMALIGWPQQVAEVLKEVAARRQEEQDVCHRIDTFLKTVKAPAGAPSREFYRNILLPELNRMFSDGDVHALTSVDDELVQRLLATHHFHMNPTAFQATVRRLQELRELAGRLIDAQAALRALPIDMDPERIRSELARESELYIGRDPLFRWVYRWALEETMQIAGRELSQVCTAFSESTAILELFRNNPIVEFAQKEALTAFELFKAALEEMYHEDDLPDWRVRYAVERSAFGLAQQYAAVASPSDRDRLQAYVTERLAATVREGEDFIEYLDAQVDSLEPGDDVEIIRMNLDQARSALDNHDLTTAGRFIDEAVNNYESTEASQRQTRENLIAKTVATINRAFEHLCTAGIGVTTDLSPLLVAAIQATASGGVRAAITFVTAVGDLLAGRPVDRNLVLSAPVLPAPAPAEEHARVPVELVLPVHERDPVRIDELPLLVRPDIERLLSQPSEEIDRDAAWAMVKSGSSGPIRLRAAASLFCAERQQDGHWEELLEVFFKENGLQAFQDRDYLRSAQYFLAATQVAYCACTRLDRGIEPACDAARRYALARLMHLRSSLGLKVVSLDPVLTASPRNWVELDRDYLLLRSTGDLADVLATLLRVAPDLAAEFLELPLCELPTLRTSLTRALLFGETLTPQRHALLEMVLVSGLSKADREIVQAFLSRLRDIATRELEAGRTSRRIAVAKAVEELDTATETLPVVEPLREIIRDSVRRLLPSEGSIASLANSELHFAAITKTLYLEAFEVQPELPVHVRVNLAAGSPPIRDLSVNFRVHHEALEIVRGSQSLDIPWLHAEEPVDLTCFVRRRSTFAEPPARTQPASEEFVLEVSDVGPRREGGVKLSGVIPWKGRRQSLVLQAICPFKTRLNPYSAGPAVKDLGLIKGRDDEVRDILRILRGTYQDNIPLVWGARRIGKSTLLYRLRLDPEVRRYYEAVPCDMEWLVRQNASTSTFLDGLAKHISQELVGTPAGRVPVPTLRTVSDPLEGFQTFLEELTHAIKPQALLLMLDEMERFFDVLKDHKQSLDYGRYDKALHEDIVHMLRHNMQHKQNVSFIMSGTQRLRDIAGDMGERLFQLPVPIQVGELKQADARALITDPVSGTFTYSSAATERLLELTTCHPYLLQAICHEVFSFIQDNRLSVCSTREIDRIIHERVLTQPTYFEFQMGPLKNSPERMRIARSVAELTLEERRTDPESVAARIALQEEDPAVANPTDELRALVEEGLLKEWRGREYRFRFPIVGRYIAFQFER